MANKKLTEKNKYDTALTHLEVEVIKERMSVGAALARAFLLGAEFQKEQEKS